MRIKLEIAFWSASGCSNRDVSQASSLECTLSYHPLVNAMVYENNWKNSAAKVMQAPDDNQKEFARITMS